MKFGLDAFALAIGAAGISQGAIAGPPGPPGPPTISAPDEKLLDQITDTFFTNLRAGKTQLAVDGFFANSSLMQSKSAQMQLLASQIDGTLNIYGKLGACDNIETITKGSMVEYRLLVCQHENLVTKWTLSFHRTTKGWIGANIFFKDQPAEPD